MSAPVPIAGALLVSTTLHGLYLLSPIDGSVIDGIHTGAGFSMAPAVHGLPRVHPEQQRLAAVDPRHAAADVTGRARAPAMRLEHAPSTIPYFL